MILLYIINVALVLGACLAFYKILLRRETFYKTNRFVLLVCLGIAFSLPLVSIPEQFSLRKADNEKQLEVAKTSTASVIQTDRPTSNIQLPTSNVPTARPTSNI